jgi:hypothetical protein
LTEEEEEEEGGFERRRDPTMVLMHIEEVESGYLKEDLA